VIMFLFFSSVFSKYTLALLRCIFCRVISFCFPHPAAVFSPLEHMLELKSRSPQISLTLIPRALYD